MFIDGYTRSGRHENRADCGMGSMASENRTVMALKNYKCYVGYMAFVDTYGRAFVIK